eukprot:g1583.t1
MGNIARFEFLLILREFLRTSLHGYNREKESHVWVFSKLACWCTLAVLVLLAVVAGITAKLWAAEASTVMFGIHSAAMTAYFYYILQLVDNQMTVAQVALKTRQRWHAENRSGAEHTSDSGASMSSAQTRDLDLAARIKRERCILGFARYGIILVYMGFIIHFLATSHLFRGDVDSYVYDVPFYSIVSYCIFYIVISFLLAIKFHVRLKQALRELCRDFERQSLLPRAPDRAVLPGAQPVRELQPLRNSNVPREQLSASDNLREPPAHDSRMPPAPANPMEVCPDSRELPAPPPISHDHVVLQQLEAGAFDRGPSEEIQADGFHRGPSEEEEDEIQPGAFDRASSAQEGKIAPGRLEIVSSAGSKSIDVDAGDNTKLRALIDYNGTTPLTQYKKRKTVMPPTIARKKSRSRLFHNLIRTTQRPPGYVVHNISRDPGLVDCTVDLCGHIGLHLPSPSPQCG